MIRLELIVSEIVERTLPNFCRRVTSLDAFVDGSVLDFGDLGGVGDGGVVSAILYLYQLVG
jgi:hypothetical protein